ncbi:hypothetical protein [Streptomyces iconiensis]|uniref:HAF repeat-containing protein n=1 Tax=Streptomyces iconiensis TaxID=1384038 RepID=A0ABT6ZYQ8_9ACTN|nr:hypothetical protein [Streptomyces iconiensis]MDJ1133766.1 hypothetical protein [Streptomyces iconiensis]
MVGGERLRWWRGSRAKGRHAGSAAVAVGLVVAVALPVAAVGPGGSGGSGGPRWEAIRLTGTVGSIHIVVDTNNAGQAIGWGVTPDAEWRSFVWDGEKLKAPPALPDGTEPQFQALNEKGQIAGYDKAPDGTRRPVLWDAAGRPKALGVHDAVQVRDLNERGQVLIDMRPHQRDLLHDGERVLALDPPGPAGSTTPTQGFQLNDEGRVLADTLPPRGSPERARAFVWRAGGSTYVPEPEGAEGQNVTAAGFNEKGLVAAQAEHPVTHRQTPYLWDEAAGDGNGVRVLPNIPGTDHSRLSSRIGTLNDRGQAVGTGLNSTTGKRHAVQWTDGRPTELGSVLGGDSEAITVNASGDAVGWNLTDRGVPHAVLWREGRTHVLGTPPGYVSSRAGLVTDRGDAAGTAISETGDTHAFLWTRR